MPFHGLKFLNCKSNPFDETIHRPPPTHPSAAASNRGHSPKPKLGHKIPPFPPPTLSKVSSEHSSRRIIELIFRSSWLLSSPFRIDELFRIRHPPHAVASFESLRAAVRRRDSGDPRCAADGNEMMRFHVPSGDGGVERCGVGGMEGVRTFGGSGAAHGAVGRGSGRRGVMVCRVIVGRVGDPEDVVAGSGVDSVRFSGGEILALDARAILPCFLVIYKV